MSSYQRDYDRRERPLAFDGRERAPRPRGPAPVTLLISLVILGVVGGGVFMLYRGGVRAPSGAPAPVGAPVGDIRVAAPPQAPAADPAAGLSIYKQDPNAALAGPKFAPPPEQPAPRPVAQTAGPVAALPAGASVLYPVTPNAAPIATPAAKPAKAPSIDSILADSAAPAARPAKTETRLAKADLPAKAPTTPVASQEVKPAPKAATGVFSVQIGAFSSQALADKSWESAAGVAPGQMAGKGKHVAAVSKGGATLYRTAVTGFATRAEAEALCAKLSATGRTCFVR